MQLSRTIIATSFLMQVLSGCASYHARPLNNTDLSKALTSFNPEKISTQATLLRHPRIPCMKIDFSKPLTAKEIAVVTVLTSPDLIALRAKEGVATAQVFDAGLLPDPQLASTLELPLQPIPGVTTAYGIGLNWDIGSLVTTQTKLRVVKAQRDQVRYDVAWHEWLSANQAELLASQIYFLNKQVMLAEKATKAAQQVMKVTQGNLNLHRITIDQFGLRQATYLDFVDQRINLARTLRKTILQFNQLLGLAPDKNLPISISPDKLYTPLSYDKLFEEAKVYRLDLLALQAGYQSQEAILYQAILGQFPHFNIGILRGRDNTNNNFIGGGITFDIPLINRNQGIIAVAKATRNQLYLEYIARLNQTRSDIATLIADLELINQEKTILDAQLPAMRKTEHLMRAGVEMGNITLIAYQSVLISLVTNELRLLSLKQNMTAQQIALRIATGKYEGAC